MRDERGTVLSLWTPPASRLIPCRDRPGWFFVLDERGLPMPALYEAPLPLSNDPLYLPAEEGDAE